jgi:hypothetical protein
MSTWVQHMSGQGEKYKVFEPTRGSDHDPIEQWLVNHPSKKDLLYYLPKSEYRECEPPEKWVDVTEGCSVGGVTHTSIFLPNGDSLWAKLQGYRLRKVRVWVDGTELGQAVKSPAWAFIVEQRKA